MLPGLIGYGLVATPQSDGGALPCLWRLCFGFRCPGCGLSRANSLLINGSIREAVAMNWLIVPLWAVSMWYFVALLLTFNSRGTSWLNSAQQNSPSW
jgi:hypothetical protein